MVFEQALYLSVLGLAVLITLGLAVLGFIRHRINGAWSFSCIMLAGLLYALGSYFEIQATTVDSVHAWLFVEYLGISVIGPFWLLLARTMTGQRAPRTSLRASLLFIIPLATVIMVGTNDFHHLYYSSIILSFQGPFTIPLLGKGIWYWVHLFYMNLCIMVGSLITLQRALTSAPVFRKQALVMFTGSIMPWLGMIAYQAGLSPYGLDVSPFGIMLAGLIYAWGLFRYGLLDLSPIVHENVFTGMRDGVLVVDLKGRLIGINPACLRILPEISLERIGEPVAGLLSPHPALLDCLMSPGQAPRDLVFLVQQQERHYEVDATALQDERQRTIGTILNFSDISTRVALLAEMERMASTDGLTGLANRRVFMIHALRELERSRRAGTPLSLIMLDLDHFKSINDSHGHQAGDSVLIHAARTCLANLRVTDLACRYGGEEFLILLPGSSPDEARIVAERIRLNLASTSVDCDGTAVSCTASLGIGHRSHASPAELDTLIAEADAAMYEAKAAGRNTVRCR